MFAGGELYSPASELYSPASELFSPASELFSPASELFSPASGPQDQTTHVKRLFYFQQLTETRVNKLRRLSTKHVTSILYVLKKVLLHIVKQ